MAMLNNQMLYTNMYPMNDPNAAARTSAWVYKASAGILRDPPVPHTDR